jgi:hypothetical protein
MPKISALPPAGTLADDDETPFVDDSVAITKKFTLAGLKAWLQSLTAWVTAPMRTQVIKAGTFSVSGNGAIAVTGVGFTPKAVILFAGIAGGAAAASSRGMSMGVMDGTNQSALMQSDREAHGSASEQFTNAALVIGTIASGGASYSEDPRLVYNAFGADGFTVTASNYATTRTISYIAIA